MNDFSYIIGMLISAGLVLAWFSPHPPIYICKFLRRLGWHKNDPNFWPADETYKYWLRHEWDTWAATALPHFLGDLLGCPVCLSFHTSFWVSVVFYFLGYWSAACILPYAFSWPILINILLTHTKE